MKTQEQHDLLVEVKEKINNIPEYIPYKRTPGDTWFQLEVLEIVRDQETGDVCGTAACVAGWACILHDKGDDPGDAVYPKYSDVPGGMNKAQELLGLEWGESRELFSVSNDLEAVNRLLDLHIAEEVTT